MFGGFGFDGMGGPFGGMGGAATGPAKSDNTRYYKLLNVDKNATAEQLKKAHRKMALKHHPDKGGDSEKFKEINEAYDVLKDENKRRIYDQYGEDAVKDGMGSGGGGTDMSDILSGMFGMGGSRGRSRGPKKSEDVTHTLKVSLADLYNGATRKLALTRSVRCTQCHGVGTASGKKYECSTCNGSGQEVRTMRIGPGMVQQMVSTCSKCNGVGTSAPSSDKCPSCNAKGLVSEKKIFEVHIEQGMKNGQRIVKRGEAGLSDPSYEPGDVIFIIETKPHPTFKRVGWDLIANVSISLHEALCGLDRKIAHLDGRQLKLQTQEGQVVKPDSWMKILEEGLPIHGRPFIKGNMYVHFNVQFPDQITPQEVKTLNAVLPKYSKRSSLSEDENMEDEDVDEVHMQNVSDIEEELKKRQAEQKAYKSSEAYHSDSDDDMPRGAQRVQCAQQ